MAAPRRGILYVLRTGSIAYASGRSSMSENTALRMTGQARFSFLPSLKSSKDADAFNFNNSKKNLINIRRLRSCFFVIKWISSLKISFIAMILLSICGLRCGLKFAWNSGAFSISSYRLLEILVGIIYTSIRSFVKKTNFQALNQKFITHWYPI